MSIYRRLGLLAAAKLTDSRKLRLFSLACCRSMFKSLQDTEPAKCNSVFWDLVKQVDDLEQIFTSTNDWSNCGHVILPPPSQMEELYLLRASVCTVANEPDMYGAVVCLHNMTYWMYYQSTEKTLDAAASTEMVAIDLINEIFGDVYLPNGSLSRPFRGVFYRHETCSSCNGAGSRLEQTYAGDGTWTPISVPCRDCLLTPGYGKDRWASWLNGNVVLLARAAESSANRDPVYGELERSTFLALADAIEEAGGLDQPCLACGGKGRELKQQICSFCNGSGRQIQLLIDHLRGPLTHVRGCHALDYLLGKNPK